MASDTPYDNAGESSERHHEQRQQGEPVQHKGPGGLMGHMYNRKLEQAQQVLGLSCGIFGPFGARFMVSCAVVRSIAVFAYL